MGYCLELDLEGRTSDETASGFARASGTNYSTSLAEERLQNKHINKDGRN